MTQDLTSPRNAAMTAKSISFTQLLLAPAVGLMHRLRYPYKFAAIGLLGLIAIAYLFVVLTANLQQSIDIARRERAGLAADQPLLSLIQLLQQHEGLTATVKGGISGLEVQRAAKMAELGRAVNKVDDAIVEHGGQLQLTASWPALKSQLDSLRADGKWMGMQQNLDAHER